MKNAEIKHIEESTECNIGLIDKYLKTRKQFYHVTLSSVSEDLSALLRRLKNKITDTATLLACILIL